jgi:hypothetical protein
MERLYKKGNHIGHVVIFDVEDDSEDDDGDEPKDDQEIERSISKRKKPKKYHIRNE